MTAREIPVVVPLVVLCGLAACALWVLRDARAHDSDGHPVGVYFGTFQVDRPETWAIACLLVWVLAFPLYLKARAES